jgi:hypothetical protein
MFEEASGGFAVLHTKAPNAVPAKGHIQRGKSFFRTKRSRRKGGAVETGFENLITQRET